MEEDENTLYLKEFARQQKNVLYHLDTTLDAYKILMQKENMDKVKAAFDFLDPYCQAVLIQSVINLNSSEFSKIENDYKELVQLASHSQDEWVRRKAYQFSQYPKIITEEDFAENLDVAALESIKTKRTVSGSFIDLIEQPLNPDIKPPSQEMAPPPPERKNVQPVQPKKQEQPSLSISTPNYARQFEPQASFAPSQPKKKKSKEMHDFNEINYMGIQPKKNK